MAEVTWTRPPNPEATFTLVLSQAEADAVNAVLTGEGEVGPLRVANHAQYNVGEDLERALLAARKRA